ncbi:MAG: response regulator transcription factor [Acidimicrobiia bacterium]|nr:response regulator transcription factor [Acidimicrobiia bacterium]
MVDRVLVVEDDPGIRSSLRLALEGEGWEVLEAESGEDAFVWLDRGRVDIALVDLMLPGVHGFDVIREIRHRSRLPIVIVTARTDTHDVVAGLELGADDYVTKPFEVRELVARLRALLRRARPTESSPAHFSFGDVEIVPAAGTVTLAGEAVLLTRTEFRLLCELAVHAGQILSREQLLERVWGYDYLGDTRLVDAHIRRLRTKVETDPAHPKLIVTVRGFGYKLEP